MAEVASRELRNGTRGLLERVEAGETMVITVDGRPVARLEPVERRSQWMPRRTFVDLVVNHQADAALAADLAALADETTDDVPLT